MANPNLKSYKTTPIIVEGADLVVDGITLPIKQKLVFQSMTYNENVSEVTGFTGAFNPMGNSTGGNNLVVTVQALFFKKNEDGSYGDRLKGGVIPEYTHSFIANNSTLVDNTTGEYLGTTGDEDKEEHTQPPLFDADGNEVQSAGKLYGKEFIKESEFFDRLGDMEYQPGVRNLIRQYITLNKDKVQPRGRF